MVKITETGKTIQEKQIKVINSAMGRPLCTLRIVNVPDDGLSFLVFLTWNKGEEWLHLYTSEGKPRHFKHFWHLMKWIAAHDIKSVELETFIIPDDIKKHLGLNFAPGQERDDASRLEHGVDIHS